MEARAEAAVVMVSLGGGDVVLVSDETNVTEQEVTEGESSLASVTEFVLADKPEGISDVLVEGEEAVVATEIAESPPAAGSTEGEVDVVDRFVVETELSLLGAETLSEVVMESVVIVVEVEVTERLGMTDSEEVVEVTEGVAGGSAGGVVLVMVVLEMEVGGSAVVSSGIEVLLSCSVTFVGVVAAAVGLAESVLVSVSAGGSALVESLESGYEIVGAVGVVMVVSAGAAAGLCLVGVFVSASCIWDSSFSGVLRPDVVGGGPGLITGFGSKAGFPADSCADTLGRI